MSLNITASFSTSRKRKLICGGALAALALTLAVSYPVKKYEGKPLFPPNIDSKYVERRYTNLLGISWFETYGEYDGKQVNQITKSVTYPDWMAKVQILSRYLPRDIVGGTSRLEIWARGSALKAYPDDSVDEWHITPPEQDLDAKAEFDEATELFQKYYGSEK